MTFNAMRRRFLEIGTGASVLAGASRFAKGVESAGEIPRRRLGHTGEMVSMVGLRRLLRLAGHNAGRAG
jgi:hypothetical protein